MSTSAATSISKTERVSQLRAEVQTHGKEVSDLQQKLEIAQRTLVTLKDKRHVFAEVGKPAGVELHSKIADAEAQIDVLQNSLTEKQRLLESARSSLETLTREIAIDEQKAARQLRFDSLAKQGREAAAHINEKVRSLLEEDLPAYDVFRDALAREFLNSGGVLQAGADASETQAARVLLRECENVFRDGSFVRVERNLRRAGWTERGDVELPIRNLSRPK